jgi:hypothetical protein
MMGRILDNLIFDNVVVWDNSRMPDWKVAGRYMATLQADTDLVYWQDDDVIVPAETQEELCGEYAWPIVANWFHGDEPAGYDDLPLVGGGAVASSTAMWDAVDRYAARWPLDDAFCYEADFVVGVLYPRFKHVQLHAEIVYDVAQHPSRLVNQPWQRELKFQITNRARRIRDADEAREYADWYAVAA